MVHSLLLLQTPNQLPKSDIHGTKVRPGPSSRSLLSQSGLKTLSQLTNLSLKISSFMVPTIRAMKTKVEIQDTKATMLPTDITNTKMMREVLIS